MNNLTRIAQKNVALIFLFKIPTLVIDFYVISLTVAYLQIEDFGIWVTFLSIMTWFSLSDFGVPTSMRNQVAKCLSRNEYAEASEYVSTTIILVFLLSLILSLLMYFLKIFVITDYELENIIKYSDLLINMAIIYSYFPFVMIIKSIMKGCQNSFGVTFIEFISSVFSLILIKVLLLSSKSSIYYLGYFTPAILIGIPVIVSFFYFKFFQVNLRPSFSNINFKKINILFNSGWKFFIIQLSSTIIFLTDYLLISSFLGPEQVTPYALTQKYFHVMTLVVSIILMPMWSAYTHAYEKQDKQWILSALRVQMMLLGVLVISLVIMVVFSRSVIIDFWIRQPLDLSGTMIIFSAFFVFIQAWNRIFNWFLSGINKLHITLYTMLFGGIINLPLSYILMSVESLGSAGVILATSISLLPFAFLGALEVRKIVRKM